MFWMLILIGLGCTVGGLIKEAAEPTVPKGIYFDWDAYWKDIENGMGIQEQIKKRQRGGYMTNNPKYAYDALNDVERYERDKAKYGVETAESWRKQGHYKIISKR